MAKIFTTLVAALATAVMTGSAALAQQPRLTNGRIITQQVTELRQVRAAVAVQPDGTWIGYAVPVVDGERSMCCYDSAATIVDGTLSSSGERTCCGVCSLDPSLNGTMMASRPQQSQPAGAIKLEGADSMVLLFRVVDRQIERVRVFSEDCQLDAGGRNVVWLAGVRAGDSLALLESLIAAPPASERRDRVVDGAITAIALHEDAGATASLERLLASAQPPHLRAKVPFWLGNTRARRGLEILQRVVKEDASVEVRKKAVFGISQSREPQAADILIENARNNPDSTIRAESIFWLAQKAGSKAAAAITERIEQDPETEVKKKAVFALSQLPKNEGVPLLLHVARTHTNPAVRKQAFFWLGQSKDPRALELFAEVLK